MFQLVPVFLGLFDSTVQKLMNGFRDIFYELAYSNLSNMLSDLNEKVGTISTELSTAPDVWQGGTIWSLIVKIAEQVALPVAGTVFTFVILWELISMLVQPNNLADVDFVSVLMKWLIKSVVAAWFISNSLTICNCFFGVGASMVSKTTTVLNQQVTDNTQDSVPTREEGNDHMADKRSKPGNGTGRTPTYQTAYHGGDKTNPLSNLARIIVEKFDKRRVPETTIDTIPFDQIYPDGLCRIGNNFYSRMVQFYDINYQLAQNDEKLMADKEVSSLVCATDAGREGELIFRLVYNQAGCKKPFERLWISSMEESAVREGFANLKPGCEYDSLYASALARQKADWLVGINGTRLFTTLYNRLLKVGRVQTPTLSLYFYDFCNRHLYHLPSFLSL